MSIDSRRWDSGLPSQRHPQKLPRKDPTALEVVLLLQPVHGGAVGLGDIPERISIPYSVVQHIRGSHPSLGLAGGLVGHVPSVRSGEDGDVVVRWIAFPSSLQNPCRLQRKKNTLQPRSAGPAPAPPDVYGHPGGVDGAGRRIPRLPGKGAGQTGHHQFLPTSSTVLTGKSENEGPSFRASERIRNSVQLEVPVGPHLDQVSRPDEPLDLGRALYVGEVMDSRCPGLTVERCGRTSEALPLSVLGNEREDPDQHEEEGERSILKPAESRNLGVSICGHGSVGMQ